MAENILPEVPEGAVRLPLTKGFYTLVDAEDAERLVGRKMQASLHPVRSPCAVLGVGFGRKGRKNVYLHRFLTEARTGLWVDHINGDTLDNRRSNLRVCTPAENRVNEGKRRTANPTSKYKGVNREASGRFRATLSVSGTVVWREYFADEIEAAKAYDGAAARHHGAFARLNFPK